MRKTGSALGAVAVMSLTLAGCKVPPVDFVKAPTADASCSAIITQNVRVPLPARAGTAQAGETPSGGWDVDYADSVFGRELERMLSEPLPAAGPLAPGQQPISQSVLILSGGSQQGAFGAGFLDQWADGRNGKLPRFRLVTGISTGALQSTFAFLNQTDRPVTEYSIASESDLLQPLVKGKLEDKPRTAGTTLAKQGTLARLQPLRTKLNKIISHDIMMAVAEEEDAGRQLLVGAVEMGSGEMAVFNLTEAARIYAESYDKDGRRSETDHPQAYMRQCYIEALMASSSVPMAAAPVFIDNKMYIDGGARFGVLIDLAAGAYKSASDKAAEERRKAFAAQGIAPAPADTTPRNLFILVNATLETPQLCRLSKCPVDADGRAIPPADTAPHADWTFVQLAQRSVSVMINQAYRSSVFIADGQYRTKGFKTLFAKIEPDHLTHPATISFPGAGNEPRTCWQWRQEDERIDKPMEFFPRYMRCLIDYGRASKSLPAFVAAEKN